LCGCYHNLLGWPDGVSGTTLRSIGEQQAETLGVSFIEDTVTALSEQDDIFRASTQHSNTYEAKRLLLATGVKDNIPPFPELYPCLGISIFICPDCDGYEIVDQPTLVIGSGNVGANMAITLTNWSDKITYINHGLQPISKKTSLMLSQKNIITYDEKIETFLTKEAKLQGLVLKSGQRLEASYGFLAFGGNVVNTTLASQLGVTLQKNQHIEVNPRTKMTNVQHVWAAGDIVAHSEQVAIAMGDGLQAAIWIHKSLEEE
jgi:thioredoxin reductase